MESERTLNKSALTLVRRITAVRLTAVWARAAAIHRYLPPAPDLQPGVQWCGNAVERRSGKCFGAGTALRQTTLATGGTLTLKRSGKSRRTR